MFQFIVLGVDHIIYKIRKVSSEVEKVEKLRITTSSTTWDLQQGNLVQETENLPA